jgi:hypothetical protein
MKERAVSRPYIPTKTKLPLTLSIVRVMQAVEGYLYDDEADLLVAATSHVLTKSREPKAVVEIGSYCGKSTVIFGLVVKALCPNVKVYAIDPHEGELSVGEETVSGEPTFARFMHNITNAGLRNIVVPIKEYSFAVQWRKPISLLFIDGLHDYRSVARDFIHFAPWVVPGGYVAFHDYGKSDFPGVTAFVDEIVDLGYWQPVERIAGLIVLERPEQHLSAHFPLMHHLFGLERHLNWKQNGRTERSTPVARRADTEQAVSWKQWRGGRVSTIVADKIKSGATVLVAGLEGEVPDEFTNWVIPIFPESNGTPENQSFHADDTALIAELEVQRAEGAEYLLVTGSALAWLENHPAFRQHLEDAHFLVLDEKETQHCILYELFPINLELDGALSWRRGKRSLEVASNTFNLLRRLVGSRQREYG